MKYDTGYFFFFKQKTAYEMRISDWSSDLCTSDLEATARAQAAAAQERDRADEGDFGGLVFVGFIVFFFFILPMLSSFGRRGKRHRRHRPWGAPPIIIWGDSGWGGAGGSSWGGGSEERRVGTEWVSTCRSRGSACPEKKKE